VQHQTFVSVFSALYLVAMMFALGLELGGVHKESKEQKRRKRRLLVTGLFLELVVLPLLAFGIVRGLHTSNEVAIALILLAASPGGRYAPHLVKLGGGDMPLAVELTLFLAKITCLTAVPTAKWMLTLHTLEIHELPFLVQLVVLQLVPLYFGKWLRRRHRSLGDRLLRPAHRISIGIALVTFFVAVARNDRGILPLLEGRAWLAVALVAIAAPVLAFVFGGRHDGARRAFAIGADARELALALMMASFAFPGRGIHTALFGVWSILAVASFLIATGFRSVRGARAGGPEAEVRARDQAREAPAGARSAPAR
jgi:BASS family bile acid:Na+ symporter